MRTVTAIAALTLLGCHAAPTVHQSEEAIRLLDEAGERIHRARFVDAIVVYETETPQGPSSKRVSILFGPESRCRVETPDRWDYYDGYEIARPDEETGEVWTHRTHPSEVGPVLFVGYMLGTRTFPFAAARQLGREWWRNSFGTDCIAGMAPAQLLNCSSEKVVYIRRADEDWYILFCFSEDPVAFERYRFVPRDQSSGGILEAEYESINFPHHIDDERFRRQSLTPVESLNSP